MRERRESPARLCLGALAAAAVWFGLVGCNASAPPPRPRSLPGDAFERAGLLQRFGGELYAALVRGEPHAVLLRDGQREKLLLPRTAHQRTRGIAGGPPLATLVSTEERALWGSGQYAGLCVQSGRLERPFGAIGLREPGFVFERGLLVGRDPSGGALAGWVEGLFLLTDQGFVALEIERIEGPRRDHSDLELAVCELADPWADPQHVVVEGFVDH